MLVFAYILHIFILLNLSTFVLVNAFVCLYISCHLFVIVSQCDWCR